MEIFKGCSNCNGKRFFYTEKPISEDERKELTERANKDIKELVKDLLTQRSPDGLTPEETMDSSSGWVKVDKDMNVEPVEEPVLAGEEEEVRSKLQQILDQETGTKPAPPEKLDEEPPEPEVKPEKTKKTKKEKRTKKKPIREVRHKILGKAKPRTRPEIITIVEPGVYEIDLEQLMDRSPIIIYKDGTYLLHLPSLFNKPIQK
jgi:predicted  nucleic acid-binding Zn-ribbon protein